MGGGEVVPQAGDGIEWKQDLWGLIDMGSNGIRFSITNLSAPNARILPTLYYYRKKISLYDEQYDEDGKKVPIPESTIDHLIATLLRFKIFCTDFQVPPWQIRAVATEASRTAINSSDFLKRIADEAGLHVELLSKQDEGKIGAYGVASSFSAVRGLVMDLGGGSTQITWMSVRDGEVQMSDAGAISFPYGAAALTRQLETLAKGKSKDEAAKAVAAFRTTMKHQFREAYKQLDIPNDLILDAKKSGGFPLYLTGGGFRGWGFLLLHVNQMHGKHYPISIINGYVSPLVYPP